MKQLHQQLPKDAHPGLDQASASGDLLVPEIVSVLSLLKPFISASGNRALNTY